MLRRVPPLEHGGLSYIGSSELKDQKKSPKKCRIQSKVPSTCRGAFIPPHPSRGVVRRALAESEKRNSVSGSSISPKIAPGNRAPRAQISPARSAERTEPGFTSQAWSEAPGSFAPNVWRRVMMPPLWPIASGQNKNALFMCV